MTRQALVRRIAAASLLLMALVLGCRGAGIDPVGGETHFLKVCDPHAGDNPCGVGLTCLCNVCTVACDEQRSCPAYPGVQCLDARATCESAIPERACDVTCSDDRDCSALSSSHVCELGFCRAGTTGPPGNGSSGRLECQAGSVGVEQALLIGDNLFAGTNDVGTELEALALAAGILQAGETLRDGSSLTENALAYEGGGIADQYVAGNPDGQVRLVVMTGGGVDAVFATCQQTNPECPALASAALAAEQLLERMAADGVEDVLYVFYADSAEPGQKERVDILRSLVQTACDQAPVRCELLDLRPVFEGRYDEYVAPEGLTALGAQATAQAIWAVVEECMAP